jgi:hypothetical protein
MSNVKNQSGSLGEFTALTLAPPANQMAEEARKTRTEYRNHKAWVEIFDIHWNAAHLGVHAFVCLSATICSFIFGWDMYSGFVANVLGREEAPCLAISLVSCFLSGFAIFTSLFATRAFSAKMQEWILQQESRSGDHELIRQHRMETAHSQDQLKFAAMLLLSCSVILLITWQRYVWLLQEVDGDSAQIDYAELLVPFASYLFEVISGEMAILWVERRIRGWKVQNCFSQFKQRVAQTAMFDKKVAFHWHTAIREGEHLLMLADVRHCLYRAKYRSTDDDSYVDEYPDTSLPVPTFPEMPVGN